MRAIPIVEKDLPVIGIVGEIYCKLNEFSNQDLIRRIESRGAECRLSGIPEWLAYVNIEHRKSLADDGKRFSLDAGKSKLKQWIQHQDENALMEVMRNVLENEPGIEDILQRSQPYLPHQGVVGEMVLNVGQAIHLWENGASGIMDISPFSCMNGVVCQAIYPRVSEEHDNIPIRVFFFDQSQKDLDQDLSIFMELVHTYKVRKGNS
jgi:predicted nucleotide-binding protein (sugar kinase/HSP70/actin superfamily)